MFARTCMSSGFRKTKPRSRPCLSLCQLARAFILWQSSFSTPFFAGPVLESYTSFTTQNHPMKRYNWSIWWEEACRMCDADAPRLCHHAFLHTMALMSGPLLHIKNICLLSLQKKSSYDDVILFCAILRQSGAGGLYIWPIYNISWVVPYFQ